MMTNQSSSRGGRSAQLLATPGRSVRVSTARSSGSEQRVSARDVMRGVKAPADKPAGAVDSYPGLDAILRKARKSEKLDSDAEQRKWALNSILASGYQPAGRAECHERMEKEYIRAVSNWRADNWLLPIEKEAEFPYSRTRNLVDPMVKYGAAWLPKGHDVGPTYDHEGESIGFSQMMENMTRATMMEAADLRIKDPSFPEADPSDPVFLKMRDESPAIRATFDRYRFDRREEMWNSYKWSGYTISSRFRAFKLFSRQQQRLLDAYEAVPSYESKKVLLAHVAQHGQLIRDCPKPDPPAPRAADAAPVQQPVVVEKLVVGSVMDGVDV